MGAWLPPRQSRLTHSSHRPKQNPAVHFWLSRRPHADARLRADAPELAGNEVP